MGTGESAKLYIECVRFTPSALETYKKYPKYVAKQCRLCYIFGTAVREAVEKIDKLDDSYWHVAQLVEQSTVRDSSSCWKQCDE